MSRSEISTEFNTFVGGILTEANPINFPAGYSIDEENFILGRNGTRSRRNGLVIESSAVTLIPSTEIFLDSLVWENAGNTEVPDDLLVIASHTVDGSGNVNGLKFRYYSMSDPDAISGTLVDTTSFTAGAYYNGMSTYKNYLIRPYIFLATSTWGGWTGGSNVEAFNRMSMARYSSYTTDVQSVSSSTSALSMRIFSDYVGATTGTVSPINLNKQRTTYSNIDAVNYANRGWLGADVNAWFALKGTYPAYSQNPSYSKDKGTAYSTTYMDNTYEGLGSAPLGKILKDPFFTRFESGSGLTAHLYSGDPTKTLTEANARGFESDQGLIASTVEAFGRVFYLCKAGEDDQNGATFLGYSQVSDPRALYQANDPTSEISSALLETDGGILDVSEVGQPLTLGRTRSRMVVLGDERVMEINSLGDIFKPSEISSRIVSTNPALGVIDSDVVKNSGGSTKTFYRAICNNLISFEDSFAYFSKTGIILLTYDNNLDQLVEQSLSQDSIQTLYESIPLACRKLARGFYSKRDNTIFWMYSIDTSSSTDYTDILMYNLTLKAWTKLKVNSDNGGSIVDAFELPPGSVNTNTSNILESFKVLVKTSDYALAIADFDNTVFTDFTGSTSASEQTAFIQTGYLNANDSAKQKQSSYIVPSFLRTEDGFTDDGNGNLTPTNESSCMISAYWDYADDDVSGKINDSFEAYRYNRLYIPEDASDTFNYGQSVLTTKNRLTGRGRALSLRFETSAGKDCQLLGWNLDFAANGKV